MRRGETAPPTVAARNARRRRAARARSGARICRRGRSARPARPGWKIRKYGCASVPVEAAHCQPPLLLAGSPSTRRWKKNRSPRRQSTPQILGEEARDHHARPVVHPAGRRELAHRGVDEGIAGAAAAPGVEPRVVVVPHERVVLGLEAAQQHVRMLGEDRVIEVAPDQLVDPLARAVAARAARRASPRARRAGSCARRSPRSAGTARAARCRRGRGDRDRARRTRAARR